MILPVFELQITTVHALTLLIEASLAYHGTFLAYLQDYEWQNNYYDSDSGYYELPKKRIRKLLPRGNKIHLIADYDGRRYKAVPSCDCSCAECIRPKLCCVEACSLCEPRPQLLYVPYPVPLIVTASTVSTTIKPISSSIDTSTRSTEFPIKKLTNISLKQIRTAETIHEVSKFRSTLSPGMPSKLRYCPPTANCRAGKDNLYYNKNMYQRLLENQRKSELNGYADIETSPRPTKRWPLPKYGIVSIPDHLAEILASEMY